MTFRLRWLSSVTSVIAVAALVVLPSTGASPRPMADSERAALDWPQFHFTPDHKGFNPYETLLSPSTVGGLTEEWSTHPIAFANLQSPVVVGGVVYFGALFATPASGNRVFAVDATTGDLVWKSVATENGFVGAPAIEDGLVFAVDSFPGTLYAFEQSTGATVWTAPISQDGAFEAQPTVANGVVFVNSTQFGGKLYAFDAASGLELWSAPVNGDLLIGPPVVSGNKVFVGGQEGTLYAFRAGNGAPLWEASVGVSGFVGIVAGTGLIFAGNQDGSLYALDADTGAVAWTFETDTEIIATPAFAYGTLFVATDGQWFYAVKSSTGRPLWRYKAAPGRYFDGAPAVANGVVYEGEFVSALRAFDARSGALLWSSSSIAQDVSTSPVIVDGVVYVTTYDGNVVAFGL